MCFCFIKCVFNHRDLSWVKIYNVDQRYEANNIEGKFHYAKSFLSAYDVRMVCIVLTCSIGKQVFHLMASLGRVL